MFTKNARRRKAASATTPTAAAESLEARSLLSATATLANGVLTITGTEGGDTVTVLPVGNTQIRVLLGNGNVWGPQPSAGISSIIARMGGGNDSLTIRPERTQLNEVRVDMGAGNNEYVYVAANLVRSVQIDGRNTQLKAIASNSLGTLRADFGNGTDSLTILNASVDQVFADLGGGNDRVDVKGRSSVRSGSIKLGGGDDRLNVLSNSRVNADLFGDSGVDLFDAWRKDDAGSRLNGFESIIWR